MSAFFLGSKICYWDIFYNYCTQSDLWVRSNSLWRKRNLSVHM